MAGWMEFPDGTAKLRQDFACNTRIKSYPNGTSQILVCDRAIFGCKGWEDMRSGGDTWAPPKAKPKTARKKREEGEAASGSVERAVRRAKAQVRDYALCTPFKYFVTLTLDKEKIDRYDMKAITKKLNSWADNQVRRKGLAYILVPERHKDGAIHFHGFFNDALEAVDSGTMTMTGWKAPKKPRSAAQRREWEEKGAHPVYNLPAWTLGFTTAIELYGTYEAAVSYVCKYIGKDMTPSPDGGLVPEKIGGRWYYSGGNLGLPEVEYCTLDLREVEQREGAYQFDLKDAGLSFVQVTVKGESKWSVEDRRGATKTTTLVPVTANSSSMAARVADGARENDEKGDNTDVDTERGNGARPDYARLGWGQERIAGYCW